MNRSVLRGLFLIVLAVAAIGALALFPRHKAKPKPVCPPNSDPWVLANYDPNAEFGTYLGNGLISVRIGANGVGNQCFAAGVYEKEKIAPIPNWADIRFYDAEKQFVLDKDAPYRQTLDMRTGIFTTEATWRLGKKALVGKIEIVPLRSNPNAGAVRVSVTPNFSGEIGVDTAIAASSCPLAPVYQEHTNGGVNFARPGFVDIYSTSDKGTYVALCINHDQPDKAVFRNRGELRCWSSKRWAEKGAPVSLTSYAGVGVAPDRSNAVTQAYMACTSCLSDGWLAAHHAAMAKLWEHDVAIDGPVEDQQAIHACMFYLLQSVREGSQWSIPPMGLSSDGYSGHIFWDADVWMFPALILQHPELARSIVDYRYNTLQGALANARASGYQGAQYAWESATTGVEAIQPGLIYREERHINGDVALAQWQYYLATGDARWLKDRGYPVIKATADWWVSKAKYVPDKRRYEILQVVPPDENADLVNNSAYTNIIAQMNLRLAIQAAKITGGAANPKWAEVADKLYIPYDGAAKRFIAYDGYTGDMAKQADAELIAYPLQYVMPGMDMAPIYGGTLNYYSAKVHENGPAMTGSAYSVIAARLGDVDRAYAEFQRSYKPYFRQPFLLFNEKASPRVDSTCFLTGAAGPIQAAIFGLAGARMDYFSADPAKAELKFLPCLPRQWKSMTIKGVQWRGKEFDVTVSADNKVIKTPHVSGG